MPRTEKAVDPAGRLLKHRRPFTSQSWPPNVGLWFSPKTRDRVELRGLTVSSSALSQHVKRDLPWDEEIRRSAAPPALVTSVGPQPAGLGPCWMHATFPSSFRRASADDVPMAAIVCTPRSTFGRGGPPLLSTCCTERPGIGSGGIAAASAAIEVPGGGFGRSGKRWDYAGLEPAAASRPTSAPFSTLPIESPNSPPTCRPRRPPAEASPRLCEKILTRSSN